MVVAPSLPTRVVRSRVRRVALAAAVALAALAAGCVTQPGAPPTDAGDLAVVSTVGGFDRPWGIDFAPDGTALVTERGGTLSAIVGGSRQVVGTVPGVVAQGEGGLLGIAVHPDFDTNGRVFVCHAFGAGGVVTDVRISSVFVAPDYSMLSAARPVLTGIPAGSGNRHLGCRLGIGPDGMLWATTGDAARGIHPQDPTSRAGKVLRMTLDGAPAPGNPGAPNDPYVYTLGHRNPQGLAFRPSDGAAFSVEHGPACDDEVNRLSAGSNYGWAPTGGALGYGELVPMTFVGATAAVWSSGCPTIAPSGATFVSGPQWGPWDDQLVVAVLKDRHLRFVSMSGTTVTGTDVRLTDQGRLRAVEMGPDGRLWVAQDSSSGSVLVLEPG